MKFRNPFRTKILIFAHVEYTLIITVPFLKRATIRNEKVNLPKGYTANLIFIDEVTST